MPDRLSHRRFPPPWMIDEANNACFIVRDKNGQALGYFYFEDEPGQLQQEPQPLAVSVVQCSDWGPGSVRVRQLNTTLPTVPKQDGTGRRLAAA